MAVMVERRSIGKRWWRQILDRWPAACWLCAAAISGERSLCAMCWSRLPWLETAICPACASAVPRPGLCRDCLLRPPRVARTRAALRFEGAARRLLHAYKFHRDLSAGRALAEALIAVVSTYTSDCVLIPIPSTARRCGQRGFDPAIEIARLVANGRGLRVDPWTLRRRGERAPQSQMGGRARRRANTHNMFHVEHPRRSSARLILIDDVLTTGATSDAAARALQQAGCPATELWVCARTL